MVHVHLVGDLCLDEVIELIRSIVNLFETKNGLLGISQMTEAYYVRVFCINLGILQLVAELHASGTRDWHPREG